MTLIRKLFCGAALALVGFTAGADEAPTAEQARVIAATAVLDEWQQMPDLAIPDRLLERAQAIAVFPSTIKGAFIVGARRGRGLVTVRDANGQWSNPSFVTFSGLSGGFQAGIQASDIILVFTTRRGVEGLSGGKVTIGGDLSGAVGPVGRQISGATDFGFNAEVYSYSRAKGLFAGIAVDGSSMNIDHAANERYYGQPGLLASDLFSGHSNAPPQSARTFIAAITRLVAGGAQPAAAPGAASGAAAPAAAPKAPRPEEKGLESGGATTFPLDPPH